jgi:hypothetical protein
MECATIARPWMVTVLVARADHDATGGARPVRMKGEKAHHAPARLIAFHPKNAYAGEGNR